MSRVIRAGTRTARGRRLNFWARMCLLVVGVWLTVAPFALEYRVEESSVKATVNDTLTGVFVVALALFSLLVPGPDPRGGRTRR